MEVQVSLIDVCTDTVADTWPILLRAVKAASFVALDLELSGLGATPTQAGYGLDIDLRYKVMCDVADSRAVLSLGVACFRWVELDASSHQLSCEVEVFNIWLLSQRPYVIDPQSSKFLINHGFDFNKQFAKGLPYTPGFCEEFHPADHSPQALLAHILTSKKPVVVHNGLVDVLFLYQSFYTNLPPSLSSFQADLTELFQGGAYDTKVIAEYEMREAATYLEYIFRKSQRQNTQLKAKGQLHLKLCPVDYPSASYLELVSITPSPTRTADEIVKIQLCKTFASYGYCNKLGCQFCHDVMVVLEQEELWKEVHSERRKRKRERRKVQSQQQGVDFNPISGEGAGCGRIDSHPTLGGVGCSRTPTSEQTVWESIIGQKKQNKKAHKRKRKRKRESEGMEQSEVLLGGEESQKSNSGAMKALDIAEEHTDSLDSDTEESGQPSGTSIAELFQEELECAKTRLQSSSLSVADQRPSFGHRAGFDAFMTGYAFAFFVLRQLDVSRLDDSVVRSTEALLAGLAGMKNKLANRSKSPLQIIKSHFTRTSEGHRKAWNRTAQLFGHTGNSLTSEKK